jgi:N-dimethylarginine dimethylaminohydrolase
VLEGAGDCIYDAKRRMFFMGCGQRSDAVAAAVVDHTFGIPCVALELASASFYHLDTCFCALPCGAVIYYPEAFTNTGRALLTDHIPAADRIALGREDAEAFAANAVCVGRSIVMSACSETLRAELAERGYTVVATRLSAFLKSGGSACCLTLRLDRRIANETATILPFRRAQSA